MSAAMREHGRNLNLEACARIRDVMEGRNSLPEEMIVPEHGGPPSVKFPVPAFDANASHDVASMDRQARDFTGKYVRLRRRQTREV